jgi:molybdenum cofactor cytidylyltransferase
MRPNATIDGIVLAAGRSSRMGRPKALLPAGDVTFLTRAIRLLADAGCRSVFAVVASDDADAAGIALEGGAIVVRNPDPGSEPVDSVRAGIQASADADAVVVLPVDCPLVRSATVRALMRAWRTSAAAIVVPELDGATGHPLVLGRTLFADVLARSLPNGLHTLIEERADSLTTVAVADPGIHADIDTPAEYERYLDADRGVSGEGEP